MKIDLTFTDHPYNKRRELCRQTFADHLYSEYDTAKILEMCGNYLKLECHAQIFCSATQFLSWINAVYVSEESFTFGSNERSKQKRK